MKNERVFYFAETHTKTSRQQKIYCDLYTSHSFMSTATYYIRATHYFREVHTDHIPLERIRVEGRLLKILPTVIVWKLRHILK